MQRLSRTSLTSFRRNGPTGNGVGGVNWRLVGGTWPLFKQQIDARIAQSPTIANSTFTPAGTYPAGVQQPFFGMVVLGDGRVFFVPRNSTSARIYNPTTNGVSTPSSVFPTLGFNGGVLLRDGRVCLIPRGPASGSAPFTVQVWDPVADTLTPASNTIDTLHPESNNFRGGVLLPDGKVFCIPFSCNRGLIYDPSTNTVATTTWTVTDTSGVRQYYWGGVLMPNGKVFCTPYYTTTALIYDPATGDKEEIANFSPFAQGLSGCILLPDGRVAVMPYSAPARIYNPATGTTTVSTVLDPAVDGALYWAKSALLPDGRVFLYGSFGGGARIWDPAADTLTTPGGTYESSDDTASTIALLDGRVLIHRNQSSQILIYGGTWAQAPGGFDPNVHLSTYLNHL